MNAFVNLYGTVDGNNPYFPNQESVTIYEGETRSLSLGFVQQGIQPFSLDNITDIQIHFRAYNGTALIKTMSTGDFFPGGVEITNPPGNDGICEVDLSVDDTGELLTGEQTDFTAYLYFGLFSTGSYAGVSFKAFYPTAKGNVSIVFDGQTDLSTILADYNQAHPYQPIIGFLTAGDIRAVGSITFTNTQPADGDIITIAQASGANLFNDVYTFRNSPSGPFDVQIGLAVSDTQASLLAALTANGALNYSAADNEIMANQILLTAGNNQPNVIGNTITVVSSDSPVITTTNFAGGESTITGNEILPNGTLTLSGGTDETRIVNFYRALNMRSASI